MTEIAEGAITATIIIVEEIDVIMILVGIEIDTMIGVIEISVDMEITIESEMRQIITLKL